MATTERERTEIGETGQKIEKMTVSACQTGMSSRCRINEESGAKCGGGRA